MARNWKKEENTCRGSGGADEAAGDRGSDLADARTIGKGLAAFGAGAIAAPGFPLPAPFTTNDAPDAAGFHQILGITGTDNGAAITGLQPTGTPIPGNEPYAVDNLVSAVEPRLTAHGFGFSLANGSYSNPFYNGSNYYEYLSVPPYVKGAGPERPVAFSAAVVPKPSAASLLLAGLGVISPVSRAPRAFQIDSELGAKRSEPQSLSAIRFRPRAQSRLSLAVARSELATFPKRDGAARLRGAGALP